MFSGIIETTSDILNAEDTGGQRKFQIQKPGGWRLRAGESVCIDGVCSTVQKAAGGWFDVTYMPETLRRSTLAKMQPGRQVNLERSLTLGSLVGGHLVQGHVDTTARIERIQNQGDARIYRLKLPQRYSRYVVEKGSIAVDGISLTVMESRRGSFAVSLLDYTLSHTTLGKKSSGEAVNIEVDILAKYVERLLGR